MSRLGREQVETLAAQIEARSENARYLSGEVAAAFVLDLRDALKEIDSLKALSASQEEALAMMERGAL